MANYKERTAQIWVLQVRKKGSGQSWSVTGATYQNSKQHIQDEIDCMPQYNLDQFEYRPMRYISVDLR